MRILSLCLLLAVPAFAADTRSPSIPGNVLTCDASTRCINKIVAGRTYQVLKSANLTVMLSVSTIGKYIRADVDITNAAGQKIRIEPSDFRIDVLNPRPGRLDVVPAADVHLPPPEKLKLSKKLKQEATYIAALALLPAGIPALDPELTVATLGENDNAHGRVFFAANKKAAILNVVLPISGSVFEFPYKF